MKRTGTTRRSFLALVSSLGVGAALPGLLKAQENGTLTREAIAAAEQVAGVSFSDAERDLLMDGFGDFIESYKAIRALNISNEVPPALTFTPITDNEPPLPEMQSVVGSVSTGKVVKPGTSEQLAFMTLSELAELVRTRQISSAELTRFYLDRLRAWDDVLECVISVTEERALASAERADREIAAGHYLGPLHGIPWGAKDLLAARGYRTTWGANPYKEQVITEDAEVVRRLEAAGAVLVAKLTLGALAWGDVWFGGVTKNPWKVEQGSSGSSAGSASATAAGLVGFAIGSETWGSIVSPSTRCGTTGLRPTFGRVSRSGAMALSWSMDKLGPICRSVEDCAHVFSAIHGSDGIDPAAIDRPFSWRREVDPKRVRIGYLKSVFERTGERVDSEWMGFDTATLKTLEGLGFTLVPIELPDFPVNALSFILSVEAAAAFDELTMSGRDELLVRQVKDAWPNVFRQARLIPAVEYVQANRARWLLMQQMAEVMKDVDVYLSPSFAGDNLLLTNLTGHPCVVLPNGFRADGTPTSITFNGRLFGEEVLLAVAHMYQQATDFHRRHPDLAAQRAKQRATAAGGGN